MSGWNQYKDTRLQVNLRINRFVEEHELAAKLGAAFALALVMGGLAQVRVITPLTPVPFTMQVLGASLMGGLLGSRWGAISAMMYTGLGILGFPVFAGQVEDFQRVEWFSGIGLFTASLSAWYIVGFVAHAYIVGRVMERRSQNRTVPLIALGSAAISFLVLFAVLDIYFLTNYDVLYGTTQGAFANVWFALLSAGVLVIVAGATWLAFTTKARRERVELFFGNILGLVALYIVGMVGFRIIWGLLGYGDLTLSAWLAYSVLPFIPVDVAKILIAIGLLTLLRPTQKELDAAKAVPQGSSTPPASPGAAQRDV